MSLYLEQIRQLVQLQGVDDEIHAVEQELSKAPQTVERLTAEFAAAEAEKAKCDDKMTLLLEQDKRVALEIEEDDARIHKSKSKLMQVANSREYQAMAREMDSMEKNIHTREEERARIKEAIKSHTEDVEAANQTWETLKQALEEARASLDARMAEALAKLEVLEQRRAHAGSEIPRPVLERYEFIRRRLAHPVIVPVHDGICDGCHIAIPPQAFIDLQSGQKILNCPNCQRLIYWSEHFSGNTGSTAPDAADA